jgi:hypothetical protein
MASTSQYGNFRHGAVLVGGGNAILGIVECFILDKWLNLNP